MFLSMASRKKLIRNIWPQILDQTMSTMSFLFCPPGKMVRSEKQDVYNLASFLSKHLYWNHTLHEVNEASSRISNK